VACAHFKGGIQIQTQIQKNEKWGRELLGAKLIKHPSPLRESHNDDITID